MTMSVEIERLRTELLTKDGEIEALLGSIMLNKRAYNQKLSDSPFKSPKDPLWVRPALGEADTFARQALELKAVEYEEELSQSRAEVELLKQKLASTQEQLQSNEESGRRLAATVSTNSQRLSSDQHAEELRRQENEEELSRSKAETELLKQELASTQGQLQSNEESGRRLAATASANLQQLSLEQVADALRRQEYEEELSRSKAEVELLKQNLASTQEELAANDQARLRQKLEQSSYKIQEVLAKLSAAEEDLLYVQQEGGERELALRRALGEKEGRMSELEEQNKSWKTQVQEATALRIGMDKIVAESNARLNAALTAQRKAEQSFADLQSTLQDYRVKYTRQFDLRRQYHNYIQEQKGNIRVFCRSRPKSEAEAIEYPVEVLSYPEADRIRCDTFVTPVQPV
jgi:chromosome segregation ATPase